MRQDVVVFFFFFRSEVDAMKIDESDRNSLGSTRDQFSHRGFLSFFFFFVSNETKETTVRELTFCQIVDIVASDK